MLICSFSIIIYIHDFTVVIILLFNYSNLLTIPYFITVKNYFLSINHYMCKVRINKIDCKLIITQNKINVYLIIFKKKKKTNLLFFFLNIMINKL